jgi:hypothetical protein
MRAFVTKPFGRFAARERISDAVLRAAIRRVEAGAIDADLGGGILKLRLARDGGGKSGGFRTIVVFRRGSLAVFVYGYAKSDRSNIGADELKAFRRFAAYLLGLDSGALAASVGNGTLREIGEND